MKIKDKIFYGLALIFLVAIIVLMQEKIKSEKIMQEVYKEKIKTEKSYQKTEKSHQKSNLLDSVFKIIEACRMQGYRITIEDAGKIIQENVKDISNYCKNNNITYSKEN